MRLTLPNEWDPRPHQGRLWDYLQTGGKRAVAVWHRRAGKDALALNWSIWDAHRRVGTYWHMLPTAQQGRLVVWDGIDGQGRKFIDQAIPQALRSKTRNDEMKIELRSGSIWQVVGSDNYDRLMGGNPVGVVFSEWSLSDPRAWDYIRPILAENGGWAIFIYTPRGENHGQEILDTARHTAGWYADIQTVEDTGLITAEQVNDERLAGMSEAFIQQEFYCSFNAPNEGTYYGKLIEEAENDGRIGNVPYQRNIAVDTWWDLGIGDSTAIWFVQRAGQEIHFIDAYECEGEGLAHYAKVLQDRGYVYGTHWGPHDIEARELGTGKSRLDVAKDLGLRFKVAPKLSVEDGIESARGLLSRCWFDSNKCRDGLRSLKSYHKAYNDRRQAFLPHPEHDWSSHYSDAFRIGSLTIREAMTRRPRDYAVPRLKQTYMSS